LGFRVQGSGFRVQGSGFRVQGSGFRVQGAGLKYLDKLGAWSERQKLWQQPTRTLHLFLQQIHLQGVRV
jgi:hypothetical protein